LIAVITADRVEQHPSASPRIIWPSRVERLTAAKVRCIRDEIACRAALTEENRARSHETHPCILRGAAGVFDPDSALRPDAPLVHDELAAIWSTLATIAHGRRDAAFAQADVVVVEELPAQLLTTACLGTMVAIAPGSQEVRRQPDDVEHDAGAVTLPCATWPRRSHHGARLR